MVYAIIWSQKCLFSEKVEKVYIDPPSGLNNSFTENKMCILKKAQGGLKQSSKAWFHRFTKVMERMEYKQTQGNHTLFTKHFNNG